MPLATVGAGVVADVAPPWPFRMPRRGGPDGVSRVRAGVFERFVHVDDRPVLVRAWQLRASAQVRIAAMPAEESWLAAGREAVASRRLQRSGRGSRPRGGAGRSGLSPGRDPAERATREQLEVAIERTRNALGIDDDYGEFYARFRRDPLLGPAIRRKPWLRARRCAWPWESLAWAITEQLIEVERAHQIQRRITARWSAAMLPPDRDRALRDVPSARTIAGVAPAELAGCDLSPRRAVAMVKVAREVASGRVDLERRDDDARLTSIPEIGPWTVQVLGLKGCGDPDALPAGDLAYLKLVPRLVGMDRRATVAEVEEFYAPYAPFRGWAGLFSLAAGPPTAGAPLRYQEPNPEYEAA